MPQHAFEVRLAQSWPPDHWRDVTVIVAVSGGPDSIALLRGLAALRDQASGQLIGAHFNHRLRGDESDRDERFTVECCRGLGISCEVGHAEHDGSTAAALTRDEEWARDARYAFLSDVARRRGARYVVTAHTADDQAETILLRIIRGTGLSGLAGIPRARELTPGISLLRPLLHAPRSEIVGYLVDLCQPCRRDSSNSDPRYTRNRLRADLLPRIRSEYNANATEALVRLGQLAEETHNVLFGSIECALAESLVEQSPRAVVFDCRPLSAQPPLIVRECLIRTWRNQGWGLQAMGFREWCQLSELLQETGRIPGPPTVRQFPGPIFAECRDSRARLRQA